VDIRGESSAGVLMNTGKTILILGGGVGGLIAANELRQLLPNEHRIVLVEKNAQHFFAPSFLWLMVGERKPEQITQDVRRLVKSGVEVIIAEAQAIDLANRRVQISAQTSAQTLNYDTLIIALGAEPAPEMIAGLAETAHTFYTFDGSKKLYETLKTFSGGKVAIVVTPPYKCPGAPHEGAMLIADFFRKRNPCRQTVGKIFG